MHAPTFSAIVHRPSQNLARKHKRYSCIYPCEMQKMGKHDGWPNGIVYYFEPIDGFQCCYLTFTGEIPCIRLEHKDLSCWRLAAQAIKRHDISSLALLPQNPPWEYFSYKYGPDTPRLVNKRPLHRIGLASDSSLWPIIEERSKRRHPKAAFHQATRFNDWPPLGQIDSGGLHHGGKSILVGFILAGLVYRAIHLFAWNAPFSTSVKRFFWRASGVILACSGIIFSLQLCTPTYRDNSEDNTHAEMFYMFIILMVICYVLARVYLVAECFVDLGYLTEGVFKLSSWSPYFPHIG